MRSEAGALKGVKRYSQPEMTTTGTPPKRMEMKGLNFVWVSTRARVLA